MRLLKFSLDIFFRPVINASGILAVFAEYASAENSFFLEIILKNTPDTIDRNQLIGQIFLQPTRTAEFIILDFTIQPTGAVFPE